MRVAFAAGGTGGHLYPALSVARELRRRDPACAALFLVSPRGLERMILEDSGFHFAELPLAAAGRAFPRGGASALAGLLRALVRSLRLLRTHGAQVLVGFGAYVSAPPVLAARALGIKIILHEQNAVAGRANRWLARCADAVATGLRPCGGEWRGAARCVATGTPLRREMLERLPRGEAAGYLGAAKDLFTVLITGGSQGAHALNRAAVDAAGRLACHGGVQAVHLAGRGDYEAVAAAYARAHLPAVVLPFLKEMEWAYAAADIVLCRCGAITLAEVAQAGLPAILVPYPGSAGGHQEANAAVFERAGAALLVAERLLSADTLTDAVLSLKRDAETRAKMSGASRALAAPEATERLADLIEEVAREGGTTREALDAGRGGTVAPDGRFYRPGAHAAPGGRK